jgi:hypothetical protein
MSQESPRYRLRLPSGEEFGPADGALLAEWAHQGRVPKDGLLVPEAGGEPRSVFTEPALAAILSAPPTVAGPVARPAAASAQLGGLIPYKNPAALVGYYTSIGSLIPFVGLIAGPVAVVLGVTGLRRRKRTPIIRGAAHAWVAIIVGSIGFLISATCIGGIIAGAIAEGR